MAGCGAISPIAPDAGLFAAIDALGPVRHLVSPNMLHYAHIAAWKQRYPDAVAGASPGVRERAAGQHIAVAFDADLDHAPPPDWAETLDQLHFRGSRVLEEIVFLHRDSGTLILTDLIENFEPSRLPAGMQPAAAPGRFARSRRQGAAGHVPDLFRPQARRTRLPRADAGVAAKPGDPGARPLLSAGRRGRAAPCLPLAGLSDWRNNPFAGPPLARRLPARILAPPLSAWSPS